MVPARTGSHIIGSAPPGTGKTRKWLAPSASMWPSGARVSSSRDDLMLLVCRRRPGPSQLLDLRPIESPPYPGDIKRVRFDPTSCIRTFQQAQRCARAMLRLSGAGTPGGIRVGSQRHVGRPRVGSAYLHSVGGQHRLHVPDVLGTARGRKPMGPSAGPEDWAAGLDVGRYRRTGLGRRRLGPILSFPRRLRVPGPGPGLLT